MNNQNGTEITERLTPHIVATAHDAQGKPYFVNDHKLIKNSFDNLGGVVWMWQSQGALSIPGNMGNYPPNGDFPAPGTVKFGMTWIAPLSWGTLNFAQGDVAKSGEFVACDDPDFHTSDALELAILLSGEVDIEIPGGATATLKPGSFLVQTGVAHAWRNRGTEPCVFAMVAIGARREV